MNKREEIVEGLYQLIKKDFIGVWLLSIPTHWLIKRILIYLHSQDVVIKVDRELPPPRYPNSEMDAYIWEGQQDMLKAGYVAVEPLVEE